MKTMLDSYAASIERRISSPIVARRKLRCSVMSLSVKSIVFVLSELIAILQLS